MEAKELRIGNKICPYIKNDGEIATVLIIDGSEDRKYDNLYLECEESFEWTEFDKVSGIPLTEDILLKCKGFEEQYKGMFGSFVSAKVGELEFSFGKSLVVNVRKHQYGVILSFKNMALHEFQNLYFALTGEELEINL